MAVNLGRVRFGIAELEERLSEHRLRIDRVGRLRLDPPRPLDPEPDDPDDLGVDEGLLDRRRDVLELGPFDDELGGSPDGPDAAHVPNPADPGSMLDADRRRNWVRPGPRIVRPIPRLRRRRRRLQRQCKVSEPIHWGRREAADDRGAWARPATLRPPLTAGPVRPADRSREAGKEASIVCPRVHRARWAGGVFV